MSAWDDDDWFDDGLTPEEHVVVWKRICDDPQARRELLWLRAKEKDDEEAVRSLERLDPGLVARVMPLVEDYLARGHRFDGRRERCEGYGRLWDERFLYHAMRFRSGVDRSN